MNEHRGQQHSGVGPLGKAAEAVGGMVGTLKASMGAHSEAAFVANASCSDVYEIEAARIARQRARSPEVRQLAERILRDHQESSSHLAQVLQTHGDTQLIGEIRGDLDQHRQTLIDHLHAASDQQFDEIYLNQQKLAHREAITLFEGFDSSDDHPELVNFARATLPVLREHKEMVERIEGSGVLRS